MANLTKLLGLSIKRLAKIHFEKKFEVNKLIDNSKLGFNRENKLFICEN